LRASVAPCERGMLPLPCTPPHTPRRAQRGAP
jgi:hypothetical protein